MMKTYVKDFETSNIKNADEHGTSLAGLEGLVTLLHQPPEDTFKHRLGQSAHRIVHLFHVPTLNDEFRSDFDLRLRKVFV